MTTFPGSPKLTKGGIVGFDIFNPIASVIIFQYNPTQVSRQVEARTAEVLRLAGTPRETITLIIEVDAADYWRKGTGAVCDTHVLAGSAIGPGTDYLGNLGQAYQEGCTMTFADNALKQGRPESIRRDVSLPRRQRYHPSPADWRDEVLYFLLVDRFSDGRADTRPISPTDILLTKPGHWPGSNKAGVEEHHVAPRVFIKAHRP